MSVMVKLATTRLMTFLVLDYDDDHDDGIKDSDADDADTMSSQSWEANKAV